MSNHTLALILSLCLLVGFVASICDQGNQPKPNLTPGYVIRVMVGGLLALPCYLYLLFNLLTG